MSSRPAGREGTPRPADAGARREPPASGWQFRRSPRLRPLLFSVFAMTTVAGAVAIAFYTVNLSAERVFLDRERNDAFAEQQILAEAYRLEGRGGIMKRMERRARLAAPEAHYGMFDARGRWLSGDLLAFPRRVQIGGWGPVNSVTRKGPITLNATAQRLPDGAVLIVGRDSAGQRDFEKRTADGLIIALAIVVAVSLGMGLLLNALVIRRARAVAEVAERIAQGELGARADVSERGDSFDRIGASLNRMLDHVEELMTGMQTVTDSLAHDLRTPLTRMQASIELALDTRSSEEESRSAIEAAARDLAQVQSVFTALIDIARAESGLSREMMQPVRLDELAADIAALFAPVLEDAGQTLKLGRMDPVTIEGHEQLLRQAVGNLLFNAVRHAGSGARVSLEVRGDGTEAEIVIADDGPGIPEEHRGRVQDRFVRLDQARSGSGSGLGLSIVAAAAKLHRGTLVLDDNAPGLRAIMRLDPGRAPQREPMVSPGRARTGPGPG